MSVGLHHRSGCLDHPRVRSWRHKDTLSQEFSDVLDFDVGASGRGHQFVKDHTCWCVRDRGRGVCVGSLTCFSGFESPNLHDLTRRADMQVT